MPACPKATKWISSVEPRGKIPGISENELPSIEGRQSDHACDGDPPSNFCAFRSGFFRTGRNTIECTRRFQKKVWRAPSKGTGPCDRRETPSAYFFFFAPSERIYFRTAAICCGLRFPLKETMAVPFTPFSIASFSSLSGWAACHLGSVKSGVLMAA